MDRAADSQIDTLSGQLSSKFLNSHGPKNIHRSLTVDYFRREKGVFFLLFSFFNAKDKF